MPHHHREVELLASILEIVGGFLLAVEGIKLKNLEALKSGLFAKVVHVLKALQNGYRCQFILLIDEFGYLNLRPEQSNIFFKLMEERYHRHSTIITTNLIYDEWKTFLCNKSMVEALLSRVRHYCHTVTITGDSLRDPQG